MLQDQARKVDGLLLEGWSRELLLNELMRPLPPNTRSVGAVISRRLNDLAVTPVPRRGSMPAPRDPEAADGYWERYEEAKRANAWDPSRMLPGEDINGMLLRRTRYPDCRECRDPITTPTGTDLCVKCAGWPRCEVCSRYVQPGSACEACEIEPGTVEFVVCEVHGDRFVKGAACFQCVAPKS